MTITIHTRGTAFAAPHITTDEGQPAWAAKCSYALTDNEVHQLMEWIETTGWHVGHGDIAHDAVAPAAINPFHPEFLGGVPYWMWNLNIERGTRDRRFDQAQTQWNDIIQARYRSGDRRISAHVAAA